jgi:hypothetical protein
VKVFFLGGEQKRKIKVIKTEGTTKETEWKGKRGRGGG